MPIYRTIPVPQQHLNPNQQPQNGTGSPGINPASPHTPSFLNSPVSIYPAQPPRPVASGVTTPAIYPLYAYSNSPQFAAPPGGATVPQTNGMNSGNRSASTSPRVSLKTQIGESSSPRSGNSTSGTGTTTRRAAAAAANAANTTSSGPTTHYSHPFVNYSAPSSAPPPPERTSKSKRNAGRDNSQGQQLPPSASINGSGNGTKRGGGTNGKNNGVNVNASQGWSG